MAGIPALQKELSRLTGGNAPRLSAAVDDVDKIIELLTASRDHIAQAPDPHTAGLTLTRLQNPIREGFDAVTEDLRKVSKVQKEFGRSLDKHFPSRPLPTDHDAMADHPDLINRAIVMHLLREGQFSVASTFMRETQEHPPQSSHRHTSLTESPDEDTDMDDADSQAGDDDDDAETAIQDFPYEQSQLLETQFTIMYRILSELKAHNLLPAITWASHCSAELEARGSNLEFELCKQQYIWLFKGAAVNGLPDDGETNGLRGALRYARENFPRFQARHAKEIQQLASAIVFTPNIGDSPYAGLFAADDSAFDEVAASFTREFCSLLGLSAESPLYVAATAGAIALPKLMKYVERVKEKRTEWTTVSELAFETPLPASMIYHSIFVCPVSKEQTTDENPPMMLPCGHVLARESLQNLTKGTRFKCPYCPSEGQLKDAKQIIL
ncbi:Protein RMD5 A [Pleurostoma richardsiae]|uniref:GID complex catalytic subunit 2 n=1 Tax=Pleurostoma richardsiae TaxID=41990 RepID=A0AA38S6L9_9PEZI|nr:Protein RMD5 A [Pleurostoma richardsiae]